MFVNSERVDPEHFLQRTASMLLKFSSAGLCALLLSSQAQSADMTVQYRPLGAGEWVAELVVSNDGDPVAITGFTVYFELLTYTDLVLRQFPAGWDSIVIASSPALNSPGFLDSALVDRTQPLLPGQSQSGFSVGFSVLNQALPTALRYEIVDETYQVLASGFTRVVPEPAAWMLMIAGSCGVLCLASSTGRRSKAVPLIGERR